MELHLHDDDIVPYVDASDPNRALAILAMQQVNNVEELQTFAEMNRVEVNDLLNAMLSLGRSFWGHGLAKEKGLSEFDADPKEVEIGTQVELEHTNDLGIARRIAMDHLAEHPQYYTEILLPAEESVGRIFHKHVKEEPADKPLDGMFGLGAFAYAGVRR